MNAQGFSLSEQPHLVRDTHTTFWIKFWNQFPRWVSGLRCFFCCFVRSAFSCSRRNSSLEERPCRTCRYVRCRVQCFREVSSINQRHNPNSPYRASRPRLKCHSTRPCCPISAQIEWWINVIHRWTRYLLPNITSIQETVSVADGLPLCILIQCVFFLLAWRPFFDTSALVILGSHQGSLSLISIRR